MLSNMTKVNYAKFRLSRRIGKSVHGHPQDAYTVDSKTGH